ncbi:hypothetical protein CABS01_07455 [Colletotrichum abscissum]|uniref:Uncharacterized protein n=1 Tax=Colletotrichum abscissum TaxID=1671311 RepID=A0A9Q0B669_9PEZI|nr:uncharacterized protein CABS01_07455 [Colletotrichum abscissum]KAI3558585.1 hypothetical protein CABS02_01200 [Colletotrichum abscissum]KAK1511497.1 hypothetical protein CABS01_07455 [Colletotrichum abscissum]
MHSMSEPPEIITPQDQAGSTGYQESWSFLDDVKRRFEATQPEVYAAFIKALSNFYTSTQNPTGNSEAVLFETHETVKALLQGHGDLLERFERSLPQEYLYRRHEAAATRQS